MAENHDAELVSEDTVGSEDKPNDASYSDSKEDMFVDAPDELNIDTPIKERVAVVDENVKLEEEDKEETEVFVWEVAKLQKRLNALTDENKSLGQDGHVACETLSQLTMFLETVKEERVQHENTVRELQGVIYGKDREIDDLTAKVSELSLSHDVAISSLNSMAEAGSQVQSETNWQIEVVADRILASISTVVSQEALQDNSVLEKIIHVENCVSSLIANYSQCLYGIYQLNSCLSSNGSALTTYEDIGSVLSEACTELVELKKREAGLLEKIIYLEVENRKLVEELDKNRETINVLNADIGKTKMELEQEKTRCANVKEKLSMAVTKGKALVQERGALKQSLAEKSNEIEKYLLELQEKSNALEALESSKGQLEQLLTDKTNELEKCLIELQEKSGALDGVEVTKGELEQLLAEKQKEHEDCLIKLQEKSAAIDDFELSYVKSEAMVASLQEILSHKDSVVENIKTILSQVDFPGEVQSMDAVERIRWLAEESNKLKGRSLEFDNLKDVILSFNLPEDVSHADLVSSLGWIRESFFEAKNDANALQDQVEHLSSSLSIQLQEKDNTQKDLDDIASRLKEMEENFHRVSSEKDQIVRRLIEMSGLTTEEGEYQTSSDITAFIDRSLEKIGKQTCRSTSSYADEELFEKFQSLLFVKDQEVALCLEILGEENLMTLQVSDLSNELRKASQELAAMKEENISLQKDLERSEEKSAMLRDKLSMAIKKGKGLVQDREKLKSQLDEKNNELDKLKHEVQQLETRVDERNSQINSLSAELEHISALEAEISALKDERKQLEQASLESKDMLQKVTESFDSIITHVDSASENPLTKASFFAGYFNECQLAKVQAEEQLEKVKDEACTLEGKLEETHATLQSVERALSIAEDNINRVSEEKRQVEIQKQIVELELKKLVEDASSLNNKFDEACATRKLLEDALMQTERNISDIISEKEDAQSSRAAAEMELEKVREEVASQASKLTEAHNTINLIESALSQAENNVESLAKQKRDADEVRTNLEYEFQKLKDESESQASKMADASMTIKSLQEALIRAESDLNALEADKTNAEEEISTLNSKLNARMEELAGLNGRAEIEKALSQAENNVELLAKQNRDAEEIRTNLEYEVQKLKDASESQASKMAEASMTIKSLEEALISAENGLSALQVEKTNAEEEITTLNSKLNACMEELAGLSGSRKSRSLETTNILHDLQVLLRDDSLVNKMNSFLENKFESLKDVELVVRDIRNQFTEKNSSVHQFGNDTEDDSFVEKPIMSSLNDSERAELDNILVNSDDDDNMSLCITRLTEGLKIRNSILVDNFEGLSTFMDSVVAAVLKKLMTTRDDVVNLFEHVETLKGNVNIFEIKNQEQEKAICMLEKDVSLLLSACEKAVRELQFETKNNLLELDHIPELELNIDQNVSAEHLLKLDGSKPAQIIETLFSSATKALALVKSFERTRNVAAAVIQSLQDKLNEATIALEKALEERNLSQNQVSSLEADMDSLEATCRELKLQVEAFQSKESNWLEKEAELSSSYNNLLVKEQEAEKPQISASEIRALFDRMNDIDLPLEEPARGMESDGSSNLNKLFRVIDYVSDMRNQIDVLIEEKKELQSSLSTGTHEIQQLKEDIERQTRSELDLEKISTQLSEQTHGLKKLLGIAGATDSVGNSNSGGSFALLQALEKQLTSLLLEAENSKAKAQELDVKLLGSQKLVDELSSKVKVLEGSLQSRVIQPEVVQERSIFEAPSVPFTSEISEIEDGASLTMKSISQAPVAAQVRTVRKGSTDHLTLNIDSESDRLINHHDTDEDKGHVFKSLNMSGLIPVQGKMVADRVDGIWVSGGRVLMSRPRARLGVMAYCLFLHLWLLAAIL